MTDLSFFYQGSSDKAVLLLHGLTGAPSEMKYLGKHLHKKGFTVYAPLLAGHGGNVDDLLKTKWEDWFASADAAYQLLKKSYPHVYVSGICVGGALGLRLAAKYKDLTGAALYSMTLKYDGWNMSKASCLAPALSLIAGLPLVRRIRFVERDPYGLKNERLRQLVKTGQDLAEGALDFFPMGALNQMYRLSREIQKTLPDIKTPTLLIHAQDDDMSHPRNSEKIRDLHGGDCKLVLLEDSYHLVHVDQERKRVADLTAEFFDNQLSGERCLSV